MPGRLEGKIAVITGATNGIGRHIALLFAKEGASIVVSDLTEKPRGQVFAGTTPTHEEINASGGKAIFVKADVTKEADVAALIDAAVKEFKRVDIMVNNAGIAMEGVTPAPVWDANADDWDKVFAVNTKGVFLGCKYAARVMKDQEPGPTGDRGWIVNMASMVALIALPATMAYTSSKHTVAGITKVAALDCAPHRIHVNAVCPGFVATDFIAPLLADKEASAQIASMHPFRGLGSPNDIAPVALFLASPENSWMSGAMVPVDGGYTAQ